MTLLKKQQCPHMEEVGMMDESTKHRAFTQKMVDLFRFATTKQLCHVVNIVNRQPWLPSNVNHIVITVTMTMTA